MKKYMIRCDVEGASGVVSMEQASPNGREARRGEDGLMSDLRALAEGLMLGGADEVYIYDEHFSGRNVRLDAFGERVYVICGKPAYTCDWAGGLEADFSGLIVQGAHSKAGTPNALLAHSYEPDIADISINGFSVGEIGVEAAIAGELGVPLILVTGDSEALREASALAPHAPGVCVKESLGETSAICLPLSESFSRIRAAAESAARQGLGDLVRFEAPIRLSVRLKRTAFLDRMREKFPQQVCGDVVGLRAGSVLEAYARYWAMKAECAL